MGFLSFFVFCFIFLLSISITDAEDTLRINQTLKDGQTLVSSGEIFELGFFSPVSTNNNRHLGIWYKNIPLTVVWIANRNNPVVGRSGTLGLGSNGLLISSNNSASIWSSNTTKTLNNPILQLLDNGNLVLANANGDSEGYVWQSFDYITDNLLPEMKLGWNIKTGIHRKMTSWSSSDDPSDGDFSFTLDSPETPQLVLSKNTEKQYRWGPWDGVRFSGSSELKFNPVFIPIFNSSPEEVYYSFKSVDNSTLLRSEVTQQGLINYLRWSSDSNKWVNMVTLQRDACDRYEVCGTYASCYSDAPSCKCLKGFSPKSPEEWKRIDYTGGCVRKWELDCRNGDGFVKYKALKLPDNSHLIGNSSMSLENCEAECLKNCSCTAYTRVDIHGNGGDCLLWFGNLVDLRDFPNSNEELYIRMAQAELESIADAKRKKRVKLIVSIVVLVVAGMILFGIFGWYVHRRKAKIKGSKSNPYEQHKQETSEEDLELPLYSLHIISVATDDFSFANKIGEGGFGPVYKGVLPSGQEIAVKRLSKQSGQGLKEFKNEVLLIAKLQHRNLVKLLGCCIQGEERMLVYEYLPNKSLDGFLFDKARKEILTWEKRMNIIVGIARGLLYLHQDSRLRIIHRDLKASNILLDIEMSPKISDFGTARMFGGEQTQEMTNRVIGTYGYMSPEYAMSGHFSVKSDVFSFGVLVLEILSGKKNSGFYHPDHDLNLLGHSWKLWSEGHPLELIDAVMKEAFSEDEVLRCIQVGLLCVQQRVEDRPTMASVLLMLGNEDSRIPEPKEPGFYTNAYLLASGTDTSSTGRNPHTANKVTITILGGR